MVKLRFVGIGMTTVSFNSIAALGKKELKIKGVKMQKTHQISVFILRSDEGENHFL